MKKSLLLLGIVTVLGGGAFFMQTSPGSLREPSAPARRGSGLVTPSGKKIAVRIAETPEERALGLSGTELLPKKEGLLFLFEKPGRYPFWMKDMNYPIDIVWMKREDAGRYRVVTVAENVLPETYPEMLSPDGDSDAVLEINAFQAKALMLEKGVDILVLKR